MADPQPQNPFAALDGTSPDFGPAPAPGMPQGAVPEGAPAQAGPGVMDILSQFFSSPAAAQGLPQVAQKKAPAAVPGVDPATIKAIQRIILEAGKDKLGPTGADGVLGNETKSALMKYGIDPSQPLDATHIKALRDQLDPNVLAGKNAEAELERLKTQAAIAAAAKAKAEAESAGVTQSGKNAEAARTADAEASQRAMIARGVGLGGGALAALMALKGNPAALLRKMMSRGGEAVAEGAAKEGGGLGGAGERLFESRTADMSGASKRIDDLMAGAPKGENLFASPAGNNIIGELNTAYKQGGTKAPFIREPSGKFRPERAEDGWFRGSSDDAKLGGEGMSKVPFEAALPIGLVIEGAPNAAYGYGFDRMAFGDHDKGAERRDLRDGLGALGGGSLAAAAAIATGRKIQRAKIGDIPGQLSRPW